MVSHCFFCKDLKCGTVVLEPDESRHAARVLRLRRGDGIELLDGCGGSASACISGISPRCDEVACEVSSVERHPRPPVSIRLFIAPPKGKNMELVLKCATELGVERVSPVLCRYGVSKPEDGKEGWLKTCIAACKQSRNPWLPRIDGMSGFSAALAASDEYPFMGMVPNGRQDWPGLPAEARAGKVALWIGPEGGFSEDETGALLARGAYALTVGHHVMRVETAVPALLGAVLALLDLDSKNH